ncbi:hypothetical protein ABLE68_19970 [Nocardioides sp. CN2-186]|uniref:hypothetical protein n=1 Tax=Nocardioides tweenelious TaxID=3156607 RepID=UPI0032B39A93
MSAVMVRYRVRPECVALNESLVREVFAELEATAPEGLVYQSMLLADGVTFVHLVEAGDDEALQATPAFQRFASTVGERCENPPVAVGVRRIGRYDGSHEGSQP